MTYIKGEGKEERQMRAFFAAVVAWFALFKEAATDAEFWGDECFEPVEV